MSNILPLEKQITVIGSLAEGMSIRAIERLTGVHRDTVMRLGLKVGNACQELLDAKARNLTCSQIQADEIWGFVGKKQRRVTPIDAQEFGDVWTFVAIDPVTKFVPSFVIGKRDYAHTHLFISDLAFRVRGRIQISTDGMNQYAAVIDDVFGTNVDYGQIVKVYANAPEGARRYSPPRIASVRKARVNGSPDTGTICTSHVEKQNLTMRMHCRRLTRLTNAFSKKLENFRAAIALHFAYYNFVKTHSSLRCTPAMAAGVATTSLTVRDLILLSN